MQELQWQLEQTMQHTIRSSNGEIQRVSGECERVSGEVRVVGSLKELTGTGPA